MPNLRHSLASAVVDALEAGQSTGLHAAEEAGISNSYVTRIKKGKANPTLDTLEALCGAIGVEVQFRAAQADEMDPTVARLVDSWSQLDEPMQDSVRSVIEAFLLQADLGRQAS